MLLIIAEIGTSHGGSAEKAKKLIDCAVSAGADAVKFQWVYADEILHPKTGLVILPTGSVSLFDRFRDLECEPSFYKEMLEYAHSKNVKFICSPFGEKSLRELLSINPDYVKSASPELNHFPMLESLSSFRNAQKEREEVPVPVILSSGVSRLSDIEAALDIVGTEGVSLLHCITSYPAPESEYNLRLLENLKNIFGIETGVSDHSLDPVLVPVLSVLCGGTVIEKHITLSRNTDGLDDPVALEGEQFALMCHVARQAEAVMNRYGKDIGKQRILKELEENYEKEKIFSALGDGIKRLAESEKQNYGRTNRSLHYTRSLSKGDVISVSDIAVLRTEKILSPGISPAHLEKVLGSTLQNDVTDGDGVKFSDIIERTSQR